MPKKFEMSCDNLNLGYFYCRDFKNIEGIKLQYKSTVLVIIVAVMMIKLKATFRSFGGEFRICKIFLITI